MALDKLINVEHPHALDLGDAVEVVVGGEDVAAEALPRATSLASTSRIPGTSSSMISTSTSGHFAQAVEHVEAAAAPAPAHGVVGVGDVLQLGQHEARHHQAAGHEAGGGDVGDAAVNDDRGVDQNARQGWAARASEPAGAASSGVVIEAQERQIARSARRRLSTTPMSTSVIGNRHCTTGKCRQTAPAACSGARWRARRASRPRMAPMSPRASPWSDTWRSRKTPKSTIENPHDAVSEDHGIGHVNNSRMLNLTYLLLFGRA
jgi:hypothetical protein